MALGPVWAGVTDSDDGGEGTPIQIYNQSQSSYISLLSCTHVARTRSIYTHAPDRPGASDMIMHISFCKESNSRCFEFIGTNCYDLRPYPQSTKIENAIGTYAFISDTLHYTHCNCNAMNVHTYTVYQIQDAFFNLS